MRTTSSERPKRGAGRVNGRWGNGDGADGGDGDEEEDEDDRKAKEAKQLLLAAQAEKRATRAAKRDEKARKSALKRGEPPPPTAAERERAEAAAKAAAVAAAEAAAAQVVGPDGRAAKRARLSLYAGLLTARGEAAASGASRWEQVAGRGAAADLLDAGGGLPYDGPHLWRALAAAESDPGPHLD
jgi:membrane protein involved in colicin uptake